MMRESKRIGEKIEREIEMKKIENSEKRRNCEKEEDQKREMRLRERREYRDEEK